MSLHKFKIWAVTDGSQGMISQVMGLSKQISLNIREIKTDLIYPWNKLQPGFLPIYKWIFKNKIPKDDKPDILISCGRKSVYFSLYCKKKFHKLFNIHIQNPKISSKKFNYIVSPNHDNFFGKNVLNSVGALHHFSKNKKNANLGLLTCIVGGDNQHYHFNNEEIVTYQIVGEYESDINNNKLSVSSPLARGLINKSVDDVVEINSPKGQKTYTIKSIKYV